MEKADRYTIITSSFDNLAGKLEACSLLRLHFFVKNDPAYSDVCCIYIFFDAAGMHNFLNGCYNDDNE